MREFLSLIANLTIIVVIFMYLRQVVKSQSTPNPATWLIWLVITIMNTVSYYEVVAGNLFEWALTLTATIGLVLIFFYALMCGKLGKIGTTEIASFLLAVGIGIFWQTTGNAIAANLLLQVIFLISFVPTLIGLARRKLRERTLPWDLAVTAYVLMICTIVLDWKDGSLLALAHPIANGIVGNGSVALMIRLTRTNI